MTASAPVIHPIEAVATAAPAVPRTLYAARRALFEQQNRVLFWALCAESAVLVATLAFTFGIYRESLALQPLFIGVDQQTGALQALRPEALKLEVTDIVLRHFVEGFVEQYYERLPFVSRRDYNRAAFALAKSLTGPGSQVQEEWKKITTMLEQPGQMQEIQVDVHNSTYTGTQNGCHQDAGARPCVATVWFTRKVFNGNHGVAYQRDSIATLTFFLGQKIDPSQIRTNPIGMVITDIHESEGH